MVSVLALVRLSPSGRGAQQVSALPLNEAMLVFDSWDLLRVEVVSTLVTSLPAVTHRSRLQGQGVFDREGAANTLHFAK